MNLFVTDESPEQSAINLDDKRVRHMPKETIELLSCAIYDRRGHLIVPVPYWQKSNNDRTYEMIKMHPLTKWVSLSVDHIHWTTDHLFYLIEECHYRGFMEYYYKYRKVFNMMYSKEIKHIIMGNVLNVKKFRNSSLYKNRPDVIQAYRETMINKWFVTDEVKPVTWTNRSAPNWCSTQQSLF